MNRSSTSELTWSDVFQDTRMFLQTLTEVSCSKHDVLLQERVSLQLRAARDELHQIFFSMSSSDQMKMIRCDRQLSRERQLRTHDHKVKGSLSAATRKALERKKLKLQRKTADRKRFSPSSEDTWKLVPKICRVSKKITPLRGERWRPSPLQFYTRFYIVVFKHYTSYWM